MKYILTVILFICSITNSYSQFKEFDFSKISFNNKKDTRIFFTALWCHPCMSEYKIINKKFKEDTTFNNIIIFDALGINMSKLSKIEPNYYDSLKTFKIPWKYYTSKGFITINISHGALGKFISDFKIRYPKNMGLNKFWYGDMLIITPEGILRSEKVENL